MSFLQNDADATAYKRKPIMTEGERYAAVASCKYVQTEHLYNIQCSEIFTLRNENLHTEA